MNERIRELAEEAAKFSAIMALPADESGDKLFVEKFAELIVQECVACATWVGKMNTTAVEPVHTAQAINQRIKKHFGVEE